jgi:hypothetical protein
LPLAFCASCGGGDSSQAAQAGTPTGANNAVAANQPPTVSAIGDVYARVGQSYVFQPAARDPDGDTLSYSASNLPPWASIDAGTGRISGTPASGDLGVYESITISVADANRSVVTAPFTITVIGDVGGGTATLRWEVPPSKVDGSPLDDLAGYRILYGRSSDDLDNSVLIDGPAIVTFEFTELASGTWYFAVVGVNAEGLEGPPTTITAKSI